MLCKWKKAYNKDCTTDPTYSFCITRVYSEERKQIKVTAFPSEMIATFIIRNSQSPLNHFMNDGELWRDLYR